MYLYVAQNTSTCVNAQYIGEVGNDFLHFTVDEILFHFAFSSLLKKKKKLLRNVTQSPVD